MTSYESTDEEITTKEESFTMETTPNNKPKEEWSVYFGFK